MNKIINACFIFLTSLILIKISGLDPPVRLQTSLWWRMLDFSNHLVHLNPVPFHTVDGKLAWDLPSSNQQPMHRTWLLNLLCFSWQSISLECVTIQMKISVTNSILSWLYTLRNKGASRCHRRTFLSKWFHKEPLTSEEPSQPSQKVICGERRDYKRL